MSNSTPKDNIGVPDVHQTQPSTAIDSSRTVGEEVIANDSRRFQTRFGCLRFRPACLQFLASAGWFVVFVCLATFFQSMAVNGLLGVTISTIERRFALPSSQTAWIAATYEMAGAPALLVIGYLGSSIRRPVWIGGGLITLGLGLGIYWIPHCVAPPYRYADSGDSSNLCVETAWNISSNASLPADNRCVFSAVYEY